MASSGGGNMKMILGVVALVVAAAVGYYGYMNYGGGGEKSADTAGVEKLADNVMGKEDAPITIIEFSSMTCPHCAAFHKDTLPGLKEKYIDTGKVKYILREFPLDQLATAAFMLGRCLEKKDAYFDFIDMLYEKQREWAYGEDQVGSLKKLAQQAGFTDESFKACLDDKKLFAQVLAVKNNGSAEFQIQSTPTFFVNGTRLEGARPLADFETLFAPILNN